MIPGSEILKKSVYLINYYLSLLIREHSTFRTSVIPLTINHIQLWNSTETGIAFISSFEYKLDRLVLFFVHCSSSDGNQMHEPKLQILVSFIISYVFSNNINASCCCCCIHIANVFQFPHPKSQVMKLFPFHVSKWFSWFITICLQSKIHKLKSSSCWTFAIF